MESIESEVQSRQGNSPAARRRRSGYGRRLVRRSPRGALVRPEFDEGHDAQGVAGAGPRFRYRAGATDALCAGLSEVGALQVLLALRAAAFTRSRGMSIDLTETCASEISGVRNGGERGRGAFAQPPSSVNTSARYAAIQGTTSY